QQRTRTLVAVRMSLRARRRAGTNHEDPARADGFRKAAAECRERHHFPRHRPIRRVEPLADPRNDLAELRGHRVGLDQCVELAKKRIRSGVHATIVAPGPACGKHQSRIGSPAPHDRPQQPPHESQPGHFPAAGSGSGVSACQMNRAYGHVPSDCRLWISRNEPFSVDDFPSAVTVVIEYRPRENARSPRPVISSVLTVNFVSFGYSFTYAMTAGRPIRGV